MLFTTLCYNQKFSEVHIIIKIQHIAINIYLFSIYSTLSQVR